MDAPDEMLPRNLQIEVLVELASYQIVVCNSVTELRY